MSRQRSAALLRMRFRRRTGKTPGKPAHSTPRYWELDQQFNPFYVRAHAKSIAHALASKIRPGDYEPRPSIKIQVPKTSGGTRGINIFTVVDAAVSSWLFESLLKRNFPAFSSYAYAYRLDRNAQHAIEYISGALASKRRAYVLEYDFAKYFDSVDHAYLVDVMKAHCKVSPREEALMNAFLQHSYAEGASAYRSGVFQQSEVGFPQGASISLLFANMACFELDREIERTGATFARYADDTVILCDDYSTAHRLAGIMLAHGGRSGAGINMSKSPGISLVADPASAELKAKESFTFLGHQISAKGAAPSARTLARIKRNLSVIIYKHLLMHPQRGQVNRKRLAASPDQDLVDCLDEIRWYLYGNLSQKHLDGVLAKLCPLKLSISALSYFPLVTVPSAFVQLDGWLRDVLFRAYERRRYLIAQLGVRLPSISRNSMMTGKWHSGTAQRETSLPSVMKSWRYVRKTYLAYGVRVYSAPPPYNS
jgi:RNA-directed DNA polymerase